MSHETAKLSVSSYLDSLLPKHSVRGSTEESYLTVTLLGTGSGHPCLFWVSSNAFCLYPTKLCAYQSSREPHAEPVVLLRPFSYTVLLREQSHSCTQPISDADHQFTSSRPLFDTGSTVSLRKVDRANQLGCPGATLDPASTLRLRIDVLHHCSSTI